jgi:hypothetical protein
MAKVKEAVQQTGAVYSLEGTLLEVCSCGVLCPCWVGEDPDGGECTSVVAYRIDRGQVTGIDVSGHSAVMVNHIPGNVLAGNWEVVLLVDDGATSEQRDALVGVFSGRLGGPLADFAQLIGTVKGVESVPISHQVSGGTGTLRIPGIVEAEMEPYRGPDGSVTTLRDSIFSTVPGSPAWVSRATRHRVNLPQYGMSWEYEGSNAIQADWTMEHGGRS